MSRSVLFLAAAALVLAAPATAKKPSAIEATIADTTRNADNRAMDDGREPAAILAFSGFAKGQVVADYSAGGGYYSELIAGLVKPKGMVLALETPRFFKAEVWDKVKETHPGIVTVISDNLDLAPRSVDVVFTHLVFHDLFLPPRPGQVANDPDRVLANWYSAVRPGGHVIIVDHAGAPGDVTKTAGSLHRIDPANARAAMEKAGFVFESESAVLQRSGDDHTLRVFDPSIRGKTDRFVMKFRRP